MAIQAVITGDIVNSTKLPASKTSRLTQRIIEVFDKNKNEFYRGDSFQAYIKEPKEALRLALLCRTAAINIAKDEKVVSDVRISIGIGNITGTIRSLKTAKGEAFVLSGRMLDEIIKTEQRLAITSGNNLANEGLQVIADYINSIFQLMTAKQAEVIFELLQGQQQQAVAKKLKKTKSSIHQRVTAGRWPEIERLLQQYENIITLIK
jgi:hypothetical protein